MSCGLPTAGDRRSLSGTSYSGLAQRFSGDWGALWEPTWNEEGGWTGQCAVFTLSLAQESALSQVRQSRSNLGPQRLLAARTSLHRGSLVLTQPCAAEVAVNEFSISTVI